MFVEHKRFCNDDHVTLVSFLSHQCEHVCVDDELLKKPRGEALVEFVRVINLNIRDLQLEVRKAVDEFTGEYYYVLVCLLLVWYVLPVDGTILYCYVPVCAD